MVFIAFIINMLYIPSMTQAIFGGAAGLAENITKLAGSVASTAAMSGGG
jgi:type IV secretion system protein VirB6